MLNGIWVKGATCSGWSPGPPRVRSPMVAVTAQLPQTASCARVRIDGGILMGIFSHCDKTKTCHILACNAVDGIFWKATSFPTKNQHGLFLAQKMLTLPDSHLISLN